MDDRVLGRYRLLERIAQSSTGWVFRAFDTETDREVALKVVAADVGQDPAFRERFEREAYSARRLNDPHVVPTHSYGEIDGRLYVDMRLIDGENVAVILGGRPMDAARAVGIVEQVGDALDAVHAAGLAHGNIKTSNILLGKRDFVYLVDFGMTREGTADAATDIDGLAGVLYECLTGIAPSEGTGPPRVSPFGAPAAFDEVVARGMATDPKRRYASAGELAAAARAALDSGGSSGYSMPAQVPAAQYAAPQYVAPQYSPAAPVSVGWAAPQYPQQPPHPGYPGGYPARPRAGGQDLRRPANFIVGGILIVLAALASAVLNFFFWPDTFITTFLINIPWLVAAVAFALVAISLRTVGLPAALSAWGICVIILLAVFMMMLFHVHFTDTLVVWRFLVVGYAVIILITGVTLFAFGITTRKVFGPFGIIMSLIAGLLYVVRALLLLLVFLTGRYYYYGGIGGGTAEGLVSVAVSALALLILGVALCLGKVPRTRAAQPAN